MPLNLPENVRILVTRTDRIGDLVLSTPVFSALRKQFPKAWIVLAANLEHRDLVLGNPYLDDIIFYDKTGREKGVLGNLRFAFHLAARRFDIAIHLHPTNRAHWTSWLAGIRHRIGWEKKAPWALTLKFPDKKREGAKHEAQYNFDLLEPLGIRCPESLEMFVPVPGRWRRSLQALLSRHPISRDVPCFVIHPSASCPSKKWPASSFANLLKRLHEHYQAFFFLIGSREESELNEGILAQANVPGVNLSGRLSLGMLSALLRQSQILISNDSGPVHIAAALGLPVLSIFGRSLAGLSPKRWAPLGERSQFLWKDVGCKTCLAHRCEIHFLCLQAISVEDVLQAVETMENHFSMRMQPR